MELSKGQTQALTMVLITTVTLGGISAAYVWGTPLLKKQQGKAELQSVENDVRELRSTVINVAESGGSDEVTVETGEGRIEVNPEQDYIDVYTSSPVVPYAPGGWILLEGNRKRNLSFSSGNYSLKGESLQGVLAVKTAAGGDNSVVHYRIEFRNMKTEGEPSLTTVDLISKGRERASGTVKIRLSRTGKKETTNLRIKGEGTMSLTKKKVTVDIR